MSFEWLLSSEILVAKLCVRIKFSISNKFLNPVNLVSIYVYIDTSWMTTSVKFLQPVSPDSITILNLPLFYQIPQGLQICVTVVKPLITSWKWLPMIQKLTKMDTNVHMKGGTGVICDKSYNEKGKYWKHVHCSFKVV